jgi:uncharacterized protein
LNEELRQKLQVLKGILSRCEGAVIAFSGGVDSTFLLSIAAEVLGDRVLAVTISSPFEIDREIVEARAYAALIGVEHEVVIIDDLCVDEFKDNPPDRCYYCKKDLFTRLIDLAEGRGLPCVFEASNTNDLGDYRPGFKAIHELGVMSPLMEAGLTKGEIRDLSRERGLPSWNKPAMACLASRIPYNEPITLEKLKQVGDAEEFLYSRGFGACRVRHHGRIARIEVPPEDIEKFMRKHLREEITEHLKALGFQYVTVDLEGYRTGSLNEALDRE